MDAECTQLGISRRLLPLGDGMEQWIVCELFSWREYFRRQGLPPIGLRPDGDSAGDEVMSGSGRIVHDRLDEGWSLPLQLSVLGPSR